MPKTCNIVLDNDSHSGYNHSVAGKATPAGAKSAEPPQNCQSLQAFHGHPKAERQRVILDDVALHVLWVQTVTELQTRLREAREGKNVLPALDFARWIRNAGILKLFCNNPQPHPLPVDGAVCEKLIEDLIYDGGEMLQGGKVKPRYEASDIAEIHRKVDVVGAMLGHLAAQLQPKESYAVVTADVKALPPVASTRQRRKRKPALRVIEGGSS